MQLFYSHQITDNTIVLDETDSKHCIKTLRKSVGDNVNVVDGKGTHFLAEIIKDDANKCTLKIINKNPNFDKRKHYIHIAIAPTKSHDRLEWFVEKAVEIGVDEISFIQTKRTERKKIRINRIKRIAITAMKQTIKATLPKINELTDFRKFVENKSNANLFIAHLEDEKRQQIITIPTNEGNSIVLIGPEGDFTTEEISLTVHHGIKPVNLGNSRLRTETAGVVACHLLNIKFEN